MNICPRCGRQLADGEICNCAAQNPQNIPYPQQSGQVNLQKENGQPVPPQYGQPAPQQNPQGYGQPAPQQNPQGYGQPAPPQYPQGYNYNPQQEPPKKKGFPVGCIVALVIGLIAIPIMGVLAAILIPSMLGYVKKSNLSSTNIKAKNIFKAANTALVDLDSEGKLEELGGNFIICSDPNADFNVEGDVTELRNKLNTYVTIDENDKTWDYFFVVEDYQCVYVAASRTDLDIIGTYPTATSFTPNRFGGEEAPSDWTINDLYTDAVSRLPIFDYGDDDDWGYEDDWDDDDLN